MQAIQSTEHYKEQIWTKAIKGRTEYKVELPCGAGIQINYIHHELYRFEIISEEEYGEPIAVFEFLGSPANCEQLIVLFQTMRDNLFAEERRKNEEDEAVRASEKF